MAELIQRPRFFEGQVLGAADLTAGLEYARSQEARHDRLVHSWGIADGLALTGAPPAGGQQYVIATLGPGLAIDGTGREVVVPEAVPLDETLFARANVAVGDPDAWYPVLLAGADAPSLPPEVSHRCTAAQASRTVESYKLAFGAPGDEHQVEQQQAPAVVDGAGGAPNAPRWWLLAGFVKWDVTLGRFTAVADAANGVARRYVGVRADEVTAQGGTLTLRSRIAGTAQAPVVVLDEARGSLGLGVDDGKGGAAAKITLDTSGTVESDTKKLVLRAGPAKVVGKPMLELDETAGGGTLTFGLQDSGGKPSQLLTVDEQGNLTIAGTFNGKLAATPSVAPGTVKVQSGVASDGTILPLPDGVTDDDVNSGRVTLQFLLAPFPFGERPWDADPIKFPTWIGSPRFAFVDDDRRLNCSVLWVCVGTSAFEILPAACSYVVMAVS